MSSEGEYVAETEELIKRTSVLSELLKSGNYKSTPLITPLENELVYSVPSVAGASRQMTVHLPLPQTGMTVEAGNDAIEFLNMVIKRVKRELAKLEACRTE